MQPMLEVVQQYVVLPPLANSSQRILGGKRRDVVCNPRMRFVSVWWRGPNGIPGIGADTPAQGVAATWRRCDACAMDSSGPVADESNSDEGKSEMTVASTFGQLTQGSFTSEAAVERSREGYRPKVGAVRRGQAQMALWSERLTRQGELVTARQIAGLGDAELAALATEFALSPRYRRTDKMRFAAPAGIAAFAAGLLGLMLQDASLGAAGRGMLSAFEVLCLGSLLGGLVTVAFATMKAFSLTSVQLAYGQAGLHAGVLDEQHPWLYKTFLLMRNAAAQEYRDCVLRDRGVLRGVDCVLMREIAHADEERVMTLTARAVFEQVQGHAAVVQRTHDTGHIEPRLTLVDTSAISAAA